MAASIKALELLTSSTELRDKLEENTKFFRTALTERGLTIKPGTHPIVPISWATLRSRKSCGGMLERRLRDWLFYPVVPHEPTRSHEVLGRAAREDLNSR